MDISQPACARRQTNHSFDRPQISRIAQINTGKVDFSLKGVHSPLSESANWKQKFPETCYFREIPEIRGLFIESLRLNLPCCELSIQHRGLAEADKNWLRRVAQMNLQPATG